MRLSEVRWRGCLEVGARESAVVSTPRRFKRSEVKRKINVATGRVRLGAGAFTVNPRKAPRGMNSAMKGPCTISPAKVYI
jgi:hypothetical protein